MELNLNQNLSPSPRKRVFSGIQPTGEAHIGNYIGAMRNWVAQQELHEAFYCVVDLHAMTMPWDPRALNELTISKAAEILACGVDPTRSVLFVQSHVPAHSELAWVLICLSRMGELRRMIQFKERSKGESESVGVGLFTYPVLQAADVLLYRAHGVPVGEDQRQHIELMRELATRFNQTFGETFVVPEAMIPPQGARIMALDDASQKMSKSAARPLSTVELVDEPDVIRQKIRSAQTDSGREVRSGDDKPELTNLLTIFSLVEERPIPELEAGFEGKGYREFKDALAEVLIAHLAPIRERYRELMADRSEIGRILTDGAGRAAKVAEETLTDVRTRVGLLAGA